MTVADEPTPSIPGLNPTGARKRTRYEADDASSDTDLIPPKRTRLGNAGNASILRLPAEMVGEIGSHLITDRLESTLSALKQLRLAHRSLDKALREAVPAYDAVARLGALSSEIYDRVVPEGRFLEPRQHDISEPSTPTGSVDAAGGPPESSLEFATASDRIRAIGPILIYQPQARRSDLVDKILAIDNLPQRARAIAATAPYIVDFKPADRSRLFEGIVRAIDKVDDAYNEVHLDVWRSSESFLASTWRHMLPEDHRKIEGNLLEEGVFDEWHPRQAPSFNNQFVLSLLPLNEDRASSSGLTPLASARTSQASSPRSEAEDELSPARQPSPEAGTLLARVEAMVTAERQVGPLLPGDNPSTVNAMDRVGRTSQRIHASFDEARQALLDHRQAAGPGRSRDSRGR